MFWGQPQQHSGGSRGLSGGSSVLSTGSALPELARNKKRSRRGEKGNGGGRQLMQLSSSSSTLSSAGTRGLSWSEPHEAAPAADTTRLSGVLLTLASIVRKQLMQPPQRPLFVPPKHLGYSSLDATKQGGGPKKYYPQTVRAEDTEKYLLHTEIEETENADRKSKKIVLGKMATASADKQRYAFDRSAGNYILNAMEEEKNAKLAKVRELEQGVETQDQVVALRSEGLWIKQQSMNMDHRVKRLEHLLHILEKEQKLEIAREMAILKAGSGAKGMHAPPPGHHQRGASSSSSSASGTGYDDGQVRHHRATVAKITSERMNVADKIMRILQDYDLVSGAQMATYLMTSLRTIAGHPKHAAAMYRSSMSGITDPESLYASSSWDGKSLRKNSTNARSGTIYELQTSKKGRRKGEPTLMRTPRGKYIPIQQDGNGVVVDMGYNKGRGNFGTKAKKPNAFGEAAPMSAGSDGGFSSTGAASRRGSVGNDGSTRSSSAGSIAATSRSSSRGSLAKQLKDAMQSDIPDGPMSRRGRAAMYRNYRSLLVEEAATAAGMKNYDLQSNVGKGRGQRGGTGADLDMHGLPTQRTVSAASANSSSLQSSTASTSQPSRKSSPPRPPGLNDIAPNWFPHMGTMPAPVGVAERALRNPNDPQAGKRDGRGLPPEEVLPDDNQPFEGRVRWFAEEGDLNFYPMLTAPSFSRSFAADKIIRKMLEEKKKPTTMSGMPAYRLSMPMAGAGTYGESANSFSFLVGRPMHPKQ